MPVTYLFIEWTYSSKHDHALACAFSLHVHSIHFADICRHIRQEKRIHEIIYFKEIYMNTDSCTDIVRYWLTKYLAWWKLKRIFIEIFHRFCILYELFLAYFYPFLALVVSRNTITSIHEYIYEYFLINCPFFNIFQLKSENTLILSTFTNTFTIVY